MVEKKRSHKKKEPPKPKKATKIPRQQPLPGMENAKIARIENLALDYAELRDQRQVLSVQEVDLKTKLIDEMHKQKKTEYKRNGIDIKLTVEKEGIKVRVKAAEDDQGVSVSVSESEPTEDELEPEPVEA
jgi:hypothetical protein